MRGRTARLDPVGLHAVSGEGTDLDDAEGDLVALKRRISLVRSGAHIFAGLGMEKTANALQAYMRRLGPIVQQWEDDAKPQAEVIPFPRK